MTASDRPVLLSIRVLRALASSTRMQILRALSERPHTPAELARRLGVADPTVREHLRILRDAGLAARREEARVWAYHELTSGARGILLGPGRGPAFLTASGAALTTAGVLVLFASRRTPGESCLGTDACPVAAQASFSLPILAGVLLVAIGMAAVFTGILVARRLATFRTLP